MYYEDAEPQGVYDRLLTGKLESLLAFCQTLGWSDLVGHLQRVLPIRSTAVEALETIKAYVVPEARRLLDQTDVDTQASPTAWFWQLVHPRIAALARPRFEAGFYGDAVESCFKEINDAVKRILRDTDGRELDGASLMTTAFSVQKPIIRLAGLATESDKNIQQGYMQIFAGAMTGIRNPNAHANLNPNCSEALHLICLGSLLMLKLDGRL